MDDQTIAQATLGVLIGLSIWFVFRIVENIRTIRSQTEKFAGLELATEESTCKGPHKWDQIQLAMKELPVALHTVCTECGLVGGTGFKLNKAAMDIYHNNLNIRAERIAKKNLKEVEAQKAIEEVAQAMGGEGIDSESARYFLKMLKHRLDSVYTSED